MKIPGGLLEAVATDKDNELHKLGVQIGQIYTNYGLPIDMALDRLPHTKEQKIAILAGAQWWMIEHRRNSGATDKAIDRQKATNRNTVERFIETGESGIY